MNIKAWLQRGWRRVQNRKNNRILEHYRRRARKIAKACPNSGERLLREIDEVAKMLQFE